MADKARTALAGAMLLAGIAFFILAYLEHQPFSEAKIRQDALVETVVREAEPQEGGAKDPMDRKIDFTTLRQINPDIIGWLYAPQIGVDAPVLRGRTDTEYLSLDFEGNYSPLGSVFTWKGAGLSDRHVCLFAHNMASGQMFGQLKKYEDRQFQKDHPNLYLYTPERARKLAILSVFTCASDDAVFQDGWMKEEETVTLATCTGYGRTPWRLAVNCKVAEEKQTW